MFGYVKTIVIVDINNKSKLQFISIDKNLYKLHKIGSIAVTFITMVMGFIQTIETFSFFLNDVNTS